MTLPTDPMPHIAYTVHLCLLFVYYFISIQIPTSNNKNKKLNKREKKDRMSITIEEHYGNRNNAKRTITIQIHKGKLNGITRFIGIHRKDY